MAPCARRGLFSLKRFFAPSCLLTLLASGCVLDERDPVLEDSGGPGGTVDGGLNADGRPGSDARTDAATDVVPRVDGDAGSTPATDAPTDRAAPPPGQDVGVLDTGSSPDRTNVPDGPGTPDASLDGPTQPPPGMDSSVVDRSNPPPVDGTTPPSDTGPTCPAPQIECSGQCVSPSDPQTCGSCTHDCTNLPHVSGPVTCQTGTCVVPPSSCESGWAHCSANADDGCEVDISKPEHCGSCTTMCSSATPLCARDSADAGASSFQCKSQCAAPSPDLCGMSCVNKTTDPLNCGMCGTQCTPPATHGQPSCASSMCGFKCNTNYSPCNNDCVNFSSDPLNCQTCGHACTPPTAHGTAICTNGACGVSCEASYPNYCGGTCVNFSNDTANCGSCGNGCQAPANGTVTGCSGGQCQITCNDGYDKVGMACTQVRFYIAENGNDSSNTGTEAAPYRTWKRAADRASLVTSPKIFFKVGVYTSNTTGEDFTVKIPEGATVATLGGKVLLQGNGVAGLAFAGNGTVNGGTTVDGLTLQGFSEPFSTSAGTQTLTNVSLTDIQTPMFISGTSMTWNGFAMSSVEASGQFRVWSGNLSLTNGSLRCVVSNCLIASPSASTVEGGTLTANQVTSDGRLSITANATLTGVTLSSSCGSQNRALEAGTGTVILTNSQVTEYAQFTGTNIKTRGTTFGGFVRVSAAGTYDFGRSTDRGNNTFNGGFLVVGPSVVIDASGNRWMANEPPADGSGNVAVGTIIGGPYSTANVSIDEMSSSVKF